jgi:hypothetical protein
MFRWGKKKGKNMVMQTQLPIEEECGAESSARGAADAVGASWFFNILGEPT